MEKCLFDSHSHISDEAFCGDNKEKLIHSIEDSLVKYCMDIGTNPVTSRECVESAKKYEFCYATVGVHPDSVAEMTDEQLYPCLQLFETEEKVVAIGEIGLDYHYDDGPDRDTQKYWFGKQIDWAVEHKAPICIHSRDADEDTLKVLKEHGAFSKERYSSFPAKPDGSSDARVLMHCCSLSWEMVKEYLKLGATISLAGPVTFKNSRKPQEVAKNIPLQDLLIETDCPYMAPEPLRGTTNTPVNVQYVCKKIAELKGLTFEEVAKQTLANACRFYDIKD